MGKSDYKHKMQEKYRIFHRFIDLYEFIFIFNKERNPRRALADRIPENNTRILDVCFGTGNGSILFWNSDNIVVGVDLSFDMLAASKKKILRHRRRNVFIHQMDAVNMGFHDEQFDIVMVAFGLHDMEYDLMLRVLKEMQRVLRKGGRLYILDYEEEGMLFKRLVFLLYLRISYPRHVQEFLKYDWNQILERVGFRFDSAETYTVSKLISATK
jgi:demethylmenaquinone methyltransferase/2-methoxy-6-polyprenyl-1,4-benzoquinol methylase